MGGLPMLQPSIDAKKVAVPVSFEVLQDTDIATQVGRLFADAKQVQESLAFTMSQTNGPVGLIRRSPAPVGR
jgi:hypothetical protein